MDLDILAILATRERFKRYNPAVWKHRHLLSEFVQQIHKDLKAFYATTDIEEVDWEKFGSWFKLVKHPNLKEDKLIAYGKVFKQLINYQPSETYPAIVAALTEKAYAEELAVMAEEVAQGSTRYGMEDIQKKVEQWSKECVEDKDEYDKFLYQASWEEMLENSHGPGLDWKQLWMNQSLGPLRKGNFVALAKRPDTGGTSFLAGQANAFALQTDADHPVIWFNNEQTADEVYSRLIQEGCGVSAVQLNVHKDKYKKQWEEKYGALHSRIRLVDTATLTADMIEHFCARFNPCAVIIDQLWKVKGFEKDAGNSDVRTQSELANWARELAKTFCPVIGVYQLGTMAEGVDYPDMSMIYFSGTAVQGEADLIITIGRVKDYSKDNRRYIHFPKNKLQGGGDYYDASLRKTKYEIKFNGETGVFE